MALLHVILLGVVAEDTCYPGQKCYSGNMLPSSNKVGCTADKFVHLRNAAGAWKAFAPMSLF